MTVPQPRRPRGDLQGRVSVGGRRSRAHFAALLHLDPDAPEGRTRVAAVGWMGDHVQVEVTGPGEAWVVLHFERSRANQQGFAVAQHVAVHYRGKELWPELEQRLRRILLGAATLEDLAAVIAGDPDVKLSEDRLPRQSATDQASFDQKSMLSTWGSTEIWSQFFAVAEIARGRLDSLDIFERGSFIQHCDRDCLLVVPKGPVPMVDRVFYPWFERVRQIGRPRRRRPDDSGKRRGSVRTTDLRERDVVMGTSIDKLKQVLDVVVEQGVDDMLFLSCTCVPFVTGEDVESLVKHYRPKIDKPFFFLTTTPQSSVSVFREVLVRKRQAAEAAAGEPVPHTVNLIGYANEPALEELKGLLGEAGVGVNATFIPEMNFAAVSALPRAPVHVLYPNSLWQSTYDQLLFESRIQAVTPPAPYGRRGTERWLDEVCKAAGVRADVAGIVDRAFEPYRDAFRVLQEEASGHRLGFVVAADEVHRLTDPAGTWGVPLVKAIEEIGFGIDVMIRAHDRKSANTSAKAVQAVFAEPDRHSIKAFADRERLTRLLENGRFDAVYSDHLFDRRLTSAGKAQFSLQEFEKGLAGFLRTARRLLTVCRLPLYARYRRYLPPEDAAEGSAQ
jgi:hypothetical protein